MKTLKITVSELVLLIFLSNLILKMFNQIGVQKILNILN